MKPSALLITMNRYWGVANRLRDAAARAPRTIDVRVALAFAALRQLARTVAGDRPESPHVTIVANTAPEHEDE